MTVEIASRYFGSVLFSAKVGSLKLAVEAAVKGDANLRGSDLRGADLSGSDLRGSDLRGSDLRGSDLRGADLSYADLSYADLRDANLRGSDLSGSDLSYADLSYADLRDANLRGSDLSGSDLSYADLRDANLRGSDLSGSDPSYANLRGSDLRDAKGFNKYAVTPLLILMDQPGAIFAYKMVTSAGVSPFNGGITYEIGGEYAVKDANTDEYASCAAGINLATLDWVIRNWQPGYRVLVAEFFAGDIAAIPVTTDGKFRVHRCRIVGEKDLAQIGLTS